MNEGSIVFILIFIILRYCLHKNRIEYRGISISASFIIELISLAMLLRILINGETEINKKIILILFILFIIYRNLNMGLSSEGICVYYIKNNYKIIGWNDISKIDIKKAYFTEITFHYVDKNIKLFFRRKDYEDIIRYILRNANFSKQRFIFKNENRKLL